MEWAYETEKVRADALRVGDWTPKGQISKIVPREDYPDILEIYRSAELKPATFQKVDAMMDRIVRPDRDVRDAFWDLFDTDSTQRKGGWYV